MIEIARMIVVIFCRSGRVLQGGLLQRRIEGILGKNVARRFVAVEDNQWSMGMKMKSLMVRWVFRGK